MVAEVYKESIIRRYYTSRFSFAYLFSWISVIVILILPFFVAYNSHSFWLKTNTYREHPIAIYNYKVLFHAEGEYTDDSENNHPLDIFWSSLPSEINKLVENNLRRAEIRSTIKDDNGDNIMDALDINLKIPISSKENIYKVSSLIFFDYKLESRSKLSMDAVASISHNSGRFPGISLKTDGKMDLVIEKPLTVKGGFKYPYADSPLIDEKSIKNTNSWYINILNNYKSRNVTANYVNQDVVWTRDYKSVGINGRYFEMKATIRFPVVDVLYQPEFVEIIKGAWIQYYALFVIIYFIIMTLSKFLYRYKIVEAVPITELGDDVRHLDPYRVKKFL